MASKEAASTNYKRAGTKKGRRGYPQRPFRTATLKVDRRLVTNLFRLRRCRSTRATTATSASATTGTGRRRRAARLLATGQTDRRLFLRTRTAAAAAAAARRRRP